MDSLIRQTSTASPAEPGGLPGEASRARPAGKLTIAAQIDSKGDDTQFDKHRYAGCDSSLDAILLAGSTSTKHLPPSRMPLNQLQCILQQGLPRFNPMPGGNPRGMRQGNNIQMSAFELNDMLFPDHIL